MRRLDSPSTQSSIGKFLLRCHNLFEFAMCRCGKRWWKDRQAEGDEELCNKGKWALEIHWLRGGSWLACTTVDIVDWQGRLAPWEYHLRPKKRSLDFISYTNGDGRILPLINRRGPRNPAPGSTDQVPPACLAMSCGVFTSASQVFYVANVAWILHRVVEIAAAHERYPAPALEEEGLSLSGWTLCDRLHWDFRRRRSGDWSGQNEGSFVGDFCMNERIAWRAAESLLWQRCLIIALLVLSLSCGFHK